MDINTFNEPTFKPAKDLKTKEDKEKYKLYTTEKNRIKTDKNVSIDEIMTFSSGGKELGAEETKSLFKYDQALNQLS